MSNPEQEQPKTYYDRIFKSQEFAASMFSGEFLANLREFLGQEYHIDLEGTLTKKLGLEAQVSDGITFQPSELSMDIIDLLSVRATGYEPRLLGIDQGLLKGFARAAFELGIEAGHTNPGELNG